MDSTSVLSDYLLWTSCSIFGDLVDWSFVVLRIECKAFFMLAQSSPTELYIGLFVLLNVCRHLLQTNVSIL